MLSDIRSWAKLSAQNIRQGRLNASLLQQFFPNLASHHSTIHVVIRPLLYELPLSHKNKPGLQLPRFIAPITTIAQLKPNGRLYPVRSFIARNLFEPTAHQIYTIGALKDLDRYLRESEQAASIFSSRPKPDTRDTGVAWTKYWCECQTALETVCPQWFKQPTPYIKTDYALICQQDSLQSIYEPIKALYRYLHEHDDIELPLFQTFIQDKAPIKQKDLPLNAHFTKRLTCDREKFSYTLSQRHALAHVIEQKEGEILAINTPPSTGKTTLIKAAVINQWALAALQHRDPPISIVISSTPQSLEKISNAFGQNLLMTNNLFEGRWLPDLGKDLLQQSKSLEKIFDPQYAELSDIFFETFETPVYHQKAKEGYLINAQLNFPQISIDTIEAVIEFLQQQIQSEVNHLSSLENVWQNMTNVNQTLNNMLEDAPQDALAKAQATLQQLTLEMEELTFFAQNWKEYQNDHYKFSTWLTLLPSYSEKQFHDSLHFLNLNAPNGINFNDCKNIHDIKKKITHILNEKHKAHTQAKTYAESLQQLLSTEKMHSIDWAEAVIDLLAISGFNNINNLAQAEDAADQTIRFNLFQLITHYWEARWLLEMENLFTYPDAYHNPNNPLAILKKWRLRMMLVPCMGTTPHKLPLLYQTASDIRKDYIFNSIDLLIVDRADQISPELAAASFTLAKKALVFGDTLQADTSSLLGRYTDTANLQECGLAPLKHPEQEFLKLSSLGKTASLGNVMRIAQTSSLYHQIPQLSAGLFLTEQMASYNEIVQFCNKLCYQGALTPTRGRKIEVAIQQKKILEELPPIAYVHVDGFTLKTPNNDYSNNTEAYAIAHWLNYRKKDLEQYYQKPLHQILCIATPFPSQTQAIIEALQTLSINNNDHGSRHIKVFNSYASQNQSFPIILFSNVYSKHLVHSPISRDTKLFNATVSNACDAFLLFADMDMIENALATTPRGMLAQTLVENDNNQIIQLPQRRTDFPYTKADAITIQELNSAQEHHIFLHKALTSPHTQNIHIAAPTLELYDMADFVIEDLSLAIERGANIHIYTDIPAPPTSNNKFIQKSPRLEKIIQTFKAINIPVHIVSKIHTNILICDNHTYCTGLFQWLNSSYLPVETFPYQTLAYSGNHLAQEINIQKNALQNKIIRY